MLAAAEKKHTKKDRIWIMSVLVNQAHTKKNVNPQFDIYILIS